MISVRRWITPFKRERSFLHSLNITQSPTMFEKTYIHDTEIYRVACVSIFKPFYLRWNDISTVLHTLKRNGYVTVLNYNFSRLIRFLTYGNSRSEGDCNSPRHPSFYETSSNYVLRTNKARNKITL